MSGGFQIHKQDGTHFLTFTVVKWVDLFSKDEYKQILSDSFNFCTNKKGLEIFAYVIMSNHVHLLARAMNGDLSDIVCDFKKFTSGKLISEIRNARDGRKEWMLEMFKKKTSEEGNQKSTNQIWQYDSHPIEIFSA